MKRLKGFSGRRARLKPWLKQILPPLNFITLHYAYFIITSLLTSVIFYCSSEPRWSISYADSLFLTVSAMTEAGLNTVNLSQMTTWQQVLLWLLIILGSAIWVSIWTVLARKHAFERRFEDIVRKALDRQRSIRQLSRRQTLSKDLPIMKALKTLTQGKTERDVSDGIRPQGQGTGQPASLLPISGPVSVQKLSTSVPSSDGTVGSSSETHDATEEQPIPAAADHIVFADDVEAARPRGTSSAFNQGGNVIRRQVSDDPKEKGHTRSLSHSSYLTDGKVGRNAQFHDLSIEEREHLGGTEYRALRVLAVAVPVYFFAWQILGCVALGAWIANNLPEPAIKNGIHPWWNGVFNGVSAFNNSGMSVLDANMIPYGSSYFVLIVMGAMILAGNTAYPVFLRFWFWAMHKLLTWLTYENVFQDTKHTLEYILKYPRRVYTNLFPSRPTWWLLFMLFVLNGTDWVAFEILNIGNSNLDSIPAGSRVIDGLFQALAVRSGGFYVVPIPNLYIGLQVLYVIMMYISVYPVVITMRHSNVYEERSLGIYSEDEEGDSNEQRRDSAFATQNPQRRRPGDARPQNKVTAWGRAFRRTMSEWHGVGVASAGPQDESRISFISHQVRGQLSHDMWLLVLAVLLITIIETRHFNDDPVTYSVFNVIFEVVSAYGCVGISVGVPWNAYSFSGGWYAGSKLVLCAVMIRGRHRGLPVALDRAVRLPGDDLRKGNEEEEDYRIRRSMSMRRESVVSRDGRLRDIIRD